MHGKLCSEHRLRGEKMTDNLEPNNLWDVIKFDLELDELEFTFNDKLKEVDPNNAEELAEIQEGFAWIEEQRNLLNEKRGK